jgi:peptidoglycan/LPS O-acetylase OafA/YrhL
MGPVVLFFVLSGFVLARSLEKNPDPLVFLCHRIFRLFPAAAVAVLIFTVLHWQFGFVAHYADRGTFDPINVLLNMLMIRNDINTAMWSLTVECAAIPLIFACFFAYQKFGHTPLLVLCVILFGLSFNGSYIHLLGGFTNIAPLYAFVIGVLLHSMMVNGLKAHRVAVWAIVSIGLVLFCWLRKQTAPILFLESIGSAGLIFLVAANAGSRLFAVLDLSPIRFIGRISYSFYLLHLIGLTIATWTMPPSAILYFIFGVAYTIPMAWLSWRFIEKPSIALGRWFDVEHLVAAGLTPHGTSHRETRAETSGA